MEIFGVDLSHHNEGLSFDALVNEGVKFAILRAGYTGYGDGVSKAKDNQFENFYRECKNRGIGVGAYWFTCANTYQKGVDEANYMYDNCLKGKQFDYPIYIDVEDDTGGRYYLRNAGREAITDGICGFCDRLEQLGYYVGIYANYDWFCNLINLDRVSKFDKWLAYWTGSKPSTFLSDMMWQFGGETNYVRSPYIAGQCVDQDFCYYDYPSVIKNGGFNGYSATPQPTPPEPAPTGLKIGDYVRIVKPGNGASDGSANVAVPGYEGTITRIIDNALFPYCVSDDEGALGWYQADALELI